jgi:hypothetical protein
VPKRTSRTCRCAASSFAMSASCESFWLYTEMYSPAAPHDGRYVSTFELWLGRGESLVWLHVTPAVIPSWASRHKYVATRHADLTVHLQAAFQVLQTHLLLLHGLSSAMLKEACQWSSTPRSTPAAGVLEDAGALHCSNHSRTALTCHAEGAADWLKPPTAPATGMLSQDLTTWFFLHQSPMCSSHLPC